LFSLADASRVHPFCNLQSRARTHAVLVILNLILLMYADDTVVFSENVEDLQNIIDSVSTIANDHGL